MAAFTFEGVELVSRASAVDTQAVIDCKIVSWKDVDEFGGYVVGVRVVQTRVGEAEIVDAFSRKQNVPDDLLLS